VWRRRRRRRQRRHGRRQLVLLVVVVERFGTIAVRHGARRDERRDYLCRQQGSSIRMCEHGWSWTGGRRRPVLLLSCLHSTRILHNRGQGGRGHITHDPAPWVPARLSSPVAAAREMQTATLSLSLRVQHGRPIPRRHGRRSDRSDHHCHTAHSKNVHPVSACFTCASGMHDT
jgi:hypothetical protein